MDKRNEDKEHTITILEIEQLTHDVKRFRTTKPKEYIFTPGQATEVAINNTSFKNQFRPFTFTSLNKDDFLEFTIKEYPTDKYPNHTGITEEIHKLTVGDKFIVKEPVGTIEYKGKGVFIAGGAGVTPFIAIFRDLSKKNKLFGNTLFFSNRKKRDIIIEDELKTVFSDNNLLLILTREKRKGYEYGRIDREFLKNHIENLIQYFYICGPSGFEKEITQVLKEMGVKGNQVITEGW